MSPMAGRHENPQLRNLEHSAQTPARDDDWLLSLPTWAVGPEGHEMRNPHLFSEPYYLIQLKSTAIKCLIQFHASPLRACDIIVICAASVCTKHKT